MNNLPIDRQIAVISALVEGNSIRATVRMTGVAKDTVIKLLARIGQACAEYQDKTLRNLPCKRIQCDEIWSFWYAKEKNVPADKRGQFGYGNVWTWTALCHALALYSTYYNFCRIHQSLRVTPAMTANVTDHVWDIADIVSLLKTESAKAA